MIRHRLVVRTAALALAMTVSASGGGQVPMSNRCFTPSFWCWLPVVAPVGTGCYCGTPFGPVGGLVR